MGVSRPGSQQPDLTEATGLRSSRAEPKPRLPGSKAHSCQGLYRPSLFQPPAWGKGRGV